MLYLKTGLMYTTQKRYMRKQKLLLSYAHNYGRSIPERTVRMHRRKNLRWQLLLKKNETRQRAFFAMIKEFGSTTPPLLSIGQVKKCLAHLKPQKFLRGYLSVLVMIPRQWSTTFLLPV